MLDRDKFIQINQGFSLDTELPIDNRLVLTRNDLSELGQHEDDADSMYNLGKWPDHYFFLLEDDNQLYKFTRIHTGDVFDFSYEKLTFPIDNETLVEFYDPEDVRRIKVPIDNDSIILSEGLVKATAKPPAIRSPAFSAFSFAELDVASTTALKSKAIIEKNTIKLKAKIINKIIVDTSLVFFFSTNSLLSTKTQSFQYIYLHS